MSCGCPYSENKNNAFPLGISYAGNCNKLNVHDWLNDMQLPQGQTPFDIVEVRFKGSRKEFYKNPDKLALKIGDIVAVEVVSGHDIGEVSLTGELVRLQMRIKRIEENSSEIKSIYRIAKTSDIEKWNVAKQIEESTMLRARNIADKLKLSMKINDVEYQGDKKKATFYYTAEQRIDFRELIKKLAEEFSVRIEMKQIGMRQESSRLGGFADCGRELCCSTWLTDFKSVATNSARYQNLSLNPSKLAGQCGKLKCCLNYELDSYLDALKDFPDISIVLQTEKGAAYHQKTDIFKRIMWYSYSKVQDDAHENIAPDTWIPATVERVKEVILLNQQGIKPADVAEVVAPKEIVLDFEDVVGQDSVTRMDKKKNQKPNPRNRERGQKTKEKKVYSRLNNPLDVKDIHSEKKQ